MLLFISKFKGYSGCHHCRIKFHNSLNRNCHNHMNSKRKHLLLLLELYTIEIISSANLLHNVNTHNKIHPSQLKIMVLKGKEVILASRFHIHSMISLIFLELEYLYYLHDNVSFEEGVSCIKPNHKH